MHELHMSNLCRGCDSDFIARQKLSPSSDFIGKQHFPWRKTTLKLLDLLIR